MVGSDKPFLLNVALIPVNIRRFSRGVKSYFLAGVFLLCVDFWDLTSPKTNMTMEKTCMNEDVNLLLRMVDFPLTC